MAGCHDNGNGEANYTLTNYAGILGSVVPGDPGASPSYKAITMNHGRRDDASFTTTDQKTTEL